MKGVRFEEILGQLGSEVRELTTSGIVFIPMHYETKETGGSCAFIHDRDSTTYGPIGFDQLDLLRVFGPAKTIVIASREPDATEALSVETLLVLGHAEHHTVIVKTDPERHAVWAGWLRGCGNSAPVMHIAARGVNLDNSLAPAIQLRGTPAKYERAFYGLIGGLH